MPVGPAQRRASRSSWGSSVAAHSGLLGVERARCKCFARPQAGSSPRTDHQRVVPLKDGPGRGRQAHPVGQVEVGEQAAVVDELRNGGSCQCCARLSVAAALAALAATGNMRCSSAAHHLLHLKLLLLADIGGQVAALLLAGGLRRCLGCNAAVEGEGVVAAACVAQRRRRPGRCGAADAVRQAAQPGALL